MMYSLKLALFLMPFVFSLNACMNQSEVDEKVNLMRESAEFADSLAKIQEQKEIEIEQSADTIKCCCCK